MTRLELATRAIVASRLIERGVAHGDQQFRDAVERDLLDSLSSDQQWQARQQASIALSDLMIARA